MKLVNDNTPAQGEGEGASKNRYHDLRLVGIYYLGEVYMDVRSGRFMRPMFALPALAEGEAA